MIVSFHVVEDGPVYPLPKEVKKGRIWALFLCIKKIETALIMRHIRDFRVISLRSRTYFAVLDSHDHKSLWISESDRAAFPRLFLLSSSPRQHHCHQLIFLIPYFYLNIPIHTFRKNNQQAHNKNNLKIQIHECTDLYDIDMSPLVARETPGYRASEWVDPSSPLPGALWLVGVIVRVLLF